MIILGNLNVDPGISKKVSGSTGGKTRCRTGSTKEWSRDSAAGHLGLEVFGNPFPSSLQKISEEIISVNKIKYGIQTYINSNFFFILLRMKIDSLTTTYPVTRTPTL